MLLQSKMYRPIQSILRLYKTKNDDNFLIFDSGVGDPERVLLFQTSDGAFSHFWPMVSRWNFQSMPEYLFPNLTRLKQNKVEKYLPMYLYSCQTKVKPQTQNFS